MVATEYQVRRVPRHETMRVRGLDMHLTRWGPSPCASAPPVLLLHGWQDTGDTFQFMVDAFEQDWPLAAPDWRGFGRSEWAQGGYWFPDYLADLDALLEQLSPGVPIRIVGHSMGGNVAALYAGLRPQRVRCVANLEGFGLPRTQPDQAPDNLRKWLDQVKAVPPLKDYDSFEQLASIIRFRYPRFSEAQSVFIAKVWAKGEADGRVHLLGDARHRWVNPVLYRREETEACWRAIKAPMLMLLGEHSDFLQRLGADGTEEAFRAIISGLEIAHIAGAGHMLHIEKPDLVAARVENFLGGH
jgi:pimeloyl-ACP methyl ester carboxylesterase